MPGNINRITGLASPIDTEAIIESLVKAESAKMERIKQDKTILEWRQAEYRAVNTRLKELMDLTFNLRLQGTFNSRTVKSSNPYIVDAKAVGGIGDVTFDIEVKRLASSAVKVGGSISLSQDDKIDTAASLWSQRSKFVDQSLFADQEEGDEFSFTVNGKSFTFKNTASLDTIISTINSTPEAGVSIFYDSFTDRISITSTATGNNKAGDEIELGDPAVDLFMNKLLMMEGAVESGGENALISINGLETERTANTFVINGIAFDLRSAVPGEIVRIEAKRDTENILNKIVEWVDKYNKTIEYINSKLKEERFPDYRPLTDEQMQQLTDKQIDMWEEKAKSGLLMNDPLIQKELGRIRQAIFSVVQGLDEEYNHLSDIGITTGKYWENGVLKVDVDKLKEKIEADPDKVIRLFTKSADVEGERGIAGKLYYVIDAAIDRLADNAGKETDLVDNSSIGKRIKELNERIQKEEERIKRLEDRYWRQFTAMEKMIHVMNSQSGWLMSFFSK